MPAWGRHDSSASRYSWLKPGPPCNSNTLIGPLLRRLVHTLYLPPTTGTIRIPASRIPGGLRPSDPFTGTSAVDGALSAGEAALETPPATTDAAPVVIKK